MTVSYTNDKNDYKNFLLYTAFCNKKKIINLSVYGGVAVLSFIAMAVFLALSMNNPATLFFYVGLIFLVVTGLSVAIVYYAVNKSLKNLNKTAPDFLLITTRYEFKKDSFTVTSTNRKRKKPTVTDLDYSSIIKGVERKTFIYLYVHKNVAFMFKKQEVDGDFAELLTLLKNNLGDKFKCLRKV